MDGAISIFLHIALVTFCSFLELSLDIHHRTNGVPERLAIPEGNNALRSGKVQLCP